MGQALNYFQIFSLIALVVLIATVLTAYRRRAVARAPAILWTVLFVSASIAIIYPGITILVANFLGIKRGADLVLYLSVFGMFTGFLMVYTRLRRLDGHITTLTRELALRSGDRASSSNETESSRASD